MPEGLHFSRARKPAMQEVRQWQGHRAEWFIFLQSLPKRKKERGRRMQRLPRRNLPEFRRRVNMYRLPYWMGHYDDRASEMRQDPRSRTNTRGAEKFEHHSGQRFYDWSVVDLGRPPQVVWEWSDAEKCTYLSLRPSETTTFWSRGPKSGSSFVQVVDNCLYRISIRRIQIFTSDNEKQGNTGKPRLDLWTLPRNRHFIKSMKLSYNCHFKHSVWRGWSGNNFKSCYFHIQFRRNKNRMVKNGQQSMLPE